MARPSTIEAHPQKKKIVQALLDGESVRSIAGWAFPPVSFLTIQRYKKAIVRPAVERSNVRIRNLNRVKNQKVTPVSVEVKEEAIQAIQDAPVLELRDARIKLLQGLVDRLNVVIAERGEELSACGRCGKDLKEHPWQDPEKPERKCNEFVTVAGGKSGLVVRDYRGSGNSMLPVYKVDHVVLSEARELSKQIAQELGQWVEKQDVNVKAQVSAKVVNIATLLTPAQMREAERLALLAEAPQQLAAPVTLAASVETDSTERENASER
jgi:hypothetical protein